MKQLIHGILFYLSWGACLFGAINQAVWISFCVSITCVALAVLMVSARRRVDFLKVAVVICMGVAFEVINSMLPFYTFVPPSSYPPAWLLCFWLSFAIMFVETLKFFYAKHLAIRFVAGFIGGAGYWAGEWLGLLKFQHDYRITMAVFAVVWAVEFVVILRASQYIDKTFPQT